MAAVYEFGNLAVAGQRAEPHSVLEVVGRLYALSENAEQHLTAQHLTILELEAAPLTLGAIDLVQRHEGFAREVSEEAECLADYLYALIQPAVDPDELARLVEPDDGAACPEEAAPERPVQGGR